VGLLVLAACTGPAPEQDDVEVTPDRVQYCCDPDAPFPQIAGNLQVTNNSDYPTVVDGVEIPANSTTSVPIRMFSCGDEIVPYIIHTSPELTWMVMVEDRCPGRVEDPEEPAIEDPSLDVVSCEAAPSGDGTTWVHCTTAGPWPPAESLWSWFVQVVLLGAADEVLADCTTQRHDGVPATFCDVGDVSALEVRAPDTGPVMIFGVEGAATFQVITGTAPTPTSSITGDDVAGPVGDEDVDPPGG